MHRFTYFKKYTVVGVIGSLLLSITACQNNYSSSLPPRLQTFTSFASEKTLNTDSYVVQTIESKLWDKIELIRTPGLPQEKMLYQGRHRDSDIVKCFGTDMPSSTDFCLHDAGIPQNLKYQTPVLLIHGANTNATRAWADPDGDGKTTGLAQFLKKQGFRVFAITFANKHGDNLIWSGHINRAITRIKELTKCQKVDLIGHSKGGFALRLYVSNIGQKFYTNDVNKAIFIGTPHRGIDYSFRHPVINWGLYPATDDPVRYAPMPWIKILYQGKWNDTKDVSFSGEYFPGQSQMLAKWDNVYPLSKAENDWWTTYYGGQGFVSNSPGIDAIIQQGGNMVQKLQNTPVVPNVKVAILAGNKPDVPGIYNELTGPSDGIVFVKSATASSDLAAGGATLLSETVMPLNHLALISDSKAMEWVYTQLKN